MVILLPAQENGRPYSGQPAGMPFGSFVDTFEAETGIRVFYKEEWTEDLTVTGVWEDALPIQVIGRIISPRGMFCFEDQAGNIIITKAYRLRPDFSDDSTYQSIIATVSYTHLRAHETDSYLVCRLLLE